MQRLDIQLINYKIQMGQGDWNRWSEIKGFDAVVASRVNGVVPPSYAWFSFLLPTTPETQRRSMERVAAAYKDILPLPVPTNAHIRPRIGYISGKTNANHVSGTLFTHLFPHHDFEAVDVYVFLTAQHTANHNSDRLLQCKRLKVIALYGMTDDEAADCIHRYGIDLLIAIDGWNDTPRPAIVARHPAHVQAQWQGTAATMSAPWIDFILVDDIINGQPPGWCSETAYTLPDCYFVAGHVHNPCIPPTPTRATLNIPTDKFVFMNLNGTDKLNPDTWQMWMQILKQCPNSVLTLTVKSPAIADRLLEHARAHGVGADRFYFLPWVAWYDHVARAGVADLFLDTLYSGAHTTFAEALWMGVPAITLIGNTMSSRVGYSMLSSVGLPELAVKTRADYIKLAVQLYNEPSLLAGFKRRLMETKHQSSMFDMQKQAAAVERFVVLLRQTA